MRWGQHPAGAMPIDLCKKLLHARRKWTEKAYNDPIRWPGKFPPSLLHCVPYTLADSSRLQIVQQEQGNFQRSTPCAIWTLHQAHQMERRCDGSPQLAAVGWKA